MEERTLVYITTTIKDDKAAGEPGFYNGTNYDALYKFEFKVIYRDSTEYYTSNDYIFKVID